MKILRLLENTAYNVSSWGLANPRLARLLIISGSVLSAVLCIVAGITANDVLSMKSAPWLIIGGFLFVTAAAAYSSRFHFGKRKFLDGVLLLSAVLLFFGHGINIGYETPAQSAEVKQVVMVDSPKQARKSFRTAWKSLPKVDRKIIRSELRQAVRAMQEGGADGSGAGLILLTIGGAIILTVLLSALSCSIACSGSEGAAALVFIGGLGLIIFGVVAVLRGIRKRRDRLRGMQESVE